MSESVSRTQSGRVRRILPLIIPTAAVLSSAAYLIVKAGGIGNAPCGQRIGAAQQGGIVAACVVAFAAGHWLQRYRHEEGDGQRGDRAAASGDRVSKDRVEPGGFRSLRRARLYLRSGQPTRPTAWKTGSFITYGVLILVYASGFLAVAYETVALWPGTNIPPITTLVRCARNADVGWTIVVAGTVSFLAGHWLWPSRVPEERGA